MSGGKTRLAFAFLWDAMRYAGCLLFGHRFERYGSSWNTDSGRLEWNEYCENCDEHRVNGAAVTW